MAQSAREILIANIANIAESASCASFVDTDLRIFTVMSNEMKKETFHDTMNLTMFSVQIKHAIWN